MLEHLRKIDIRKKKSFRKIQKKLLNNNQSKETLKKKIKIKILSQIEEVVDMIKVKVD